ncbi:hypothetical protein QUF72_13760, partial [Desulfobacterales bacterium HSG2]|nr:hypothetical protein [Desulfobacterales bacterium HSG2]
MKKNIAIIVVFLIFGGGIFGDAYAAPTVTSVTSTAADGTYYETGSIAVTVIFSENVIVTGTPQLTLETGVVDYTSGTGSDTLTFNYTISESDTSTDLDYVSTAALALNGGSIKNGSGDDAVLTLPSPGEANSLGDNKAIVIDTAPNTSISTQPPDPDSNTMPEFYFAGTDAGSGVDSYQCQIDTGGWTSCISPYTTTASLGDASHTFEVRATDNAGNIDATPASYTWTVESTAPTVTINQETDQADPTNSTTIDFTVVFSESVIGFDDTDITLDGTASPTTAVITGDGPIYNVEVSGMTSAGTVTASIGEGKATDGAGKGNAASTSDDNEVTFVPPSVSSINRTDPTPTKATSVDFTVTFSESVSGIDTGDFALAATGSAGGTIASVSAASGATVTVTVDSISGNGTLGLNLTDDDTIINSVSVPLAGTGADGSFTGQTYTIDNTVPTVTIKQSDTQDDPTNIAPVNFTVVFSELVSDFAT